MIISDVRSQQLIHLATTKKEKQQEFASSKGMVFHYNNARRHTSRDTLLELGFDVM